MYRQFLSLVLPVVLGLIPTLAHADDTRAAQADATGVVPPKVELQQPQTSRKTWALRGLAVGFGTVGGVGIILGALEAGTNNNVVGAGPQRVDATAGMATGFTIGAVGLLAGGLFAY